jgi:hypothetical protein
VAKAKVGSTGRQEGPASAGPSGWGVGSGVSATRSSVAG